MHPAFIVLLTEVFCIQSLIVSLDNKKETDKTLFVVSQNWKNSLIICQNMLVNPNTLLIN